MFNKTWFKKNAVIRGSTNGVHRRHHKEQWQWTSHRRPHHGLLAGLGKVGCSLFIHALDQYRIKGKQCTNGFLSDRTQCAVIEGEMSDIIQIESVVPPGSIVGHWAYLQMTHCTPHSLNRKQHFERQSQQASHMWRKMDDAVHFRQMCSSANNKKKKLHHSRAQLGTNIIIKMS